MNSQTMGKLWMVGLLVLLVACGSQKSVKPPAPQTMGLLKVTITGIGEGASPTATAQWVQSVGTGSGVSTQAATIVPVNGGSGLNDIQLIRRNVGFLDEDVAGQRNVFATFDLINRTTTAFNNLTLYAVNVPGNLGGTGIIGLTAGTGAAITDVNVARGFKPTHGMRTLVQGLEVNPNNADLQFLTSAEAADVQNQGLTTSDPFNPPNNILPTGSTVLEYGFVARNFSGGRNIAARNGGDCTVVACKGSVTLAYQFPKVSPRNANPFSFSLFFIVANETVQIGSQSIEEHTVNTAMGLNTPSASFAQLRVLAGSNFLSDDRLKPLCRVKYAIGPDLFLGPDPIPTASGSLDVCFGASGRRVTVMTAKDEQIKGLAIQSDGKIVAVGRGNTSTTNVLNNTAMLARYNSNGSLDTGFGAGGKVVASALGSEAFLRGVVLQPDGKIVAVGGFGSMLVARFNSDGSFDNSFDGDGQASATVGAVSNALAVALQPDGKIVVAGRAFVSGADFGLVRLNPDGSLDPSFDGDATMPGFPGNGKVSTHLGGTNEEVRAIALQSDGKIVVAGVGDSQDIVLARYNSNGTLDSGFDGDGKAITAMSSGNSEANGVAIQSDGKIVVVGLRVVSGNGDMVVLRYNPDGTLDTSFDDDGMVLTDIGGGFDNASAVALQADGKILVSGFNGLAGSNFALLRYTTGGSLDTSFDGDGIVTTHLGSNSDQADAMAIQADGKIVLGGIGSSSNNTDFALARYNP